MTSELATSLTKRSEQATVTHHKRSGKVNQLALSSAIKVTVNGNYAYVARQSYGVSIVDISNPTPSIVSTYDTPGQAYKAYVQGNYLYIADYYNFIILNISTPATPTLVSTTSGATMVDLRVSGNYAYLVNSNQGLYIYDISNPATPTLVRSISTIEIGGVVRSIELMGNYAFIGANGRIATLDITNPSNASIVNQFVGSNYFHDLEVVGNRLYAANASNGFRILDVTTPTAPATLGTYNTPGDAQSVDVQGNYAFVADSNSLQILDISNATQPVLAGQYALGDTRGSAIKGDYLYITDLTTASLYTFSIASPQLANNNLTLNEGQTVTLTTSNIQATDPDNGPDNITFTATNVTAGRFELASNPGVAVTSFTQLQINDGQVKFVHDGSETAPTYQLSVLSGLYQLPATSAVITYTAVNDAPVLSTTTNTPLSFTENGTAVAIDPNVTVSDVDNTTLASATITLTDYVANEDVLAFTDQNGISGSFDTLSGVLTLTGSSSKANYQTALCSITYQNTSDNPSTAARSFIIVVSDGNLTSNTLERSLNVIAVDDAPVLAGNQSPVHYTNKGSPITFFPNLKVTDVDSMLLASASIQLTGDFKAGEDSLVFIDQNGITGTFESANGMLTLAGNASLEDYQTALRSIAYANNSFHLREGQLTLTVTINDGQSNSNAYVIMLTIDPINHAPVLQYPLGNFTVTVGRPFVLNLNKDSFIDPDNDSITYTLEEASPLSEEDFDPANFTLSGLLNTTEEVPVTLKATDPYNATGYGRFFILPQAADSTSTTNLTTTLSTLATTLMTATLGTTGSTIGPAATTGSPNSGLIGTDTSGSGDVRSSSSHGSGPNIGLIVGTVVGGLSLAFCLMAVILIYYKKQQQKEQAPKFTIELIDSSGSKPRPQP